MISYILSATIIRGNSFV